MKKTLCVATGLTVAALGSHAIGVHADEPERPSRYEVHEIGFVDLNRPETSGGWLSTVPPGTPLKGAADFRARRAAVDMFAMQGPGNAGNARGGANAGPNNGGNGGNANNGGRGRGNQPGGPAANPPPANPPANPPVPAPNMGGQGNGGGPAAPAPNPPPPWRGGQAGNNPPAPPPNAGRDGTPAPPTTNPGPPVPPRRNTNRRTDTPPPPPQDPALLFYTDQPVQVSVRVGFTDGVPVAWWPKARPDGRDLVFKDVTVSPALQAPKAEALDTAKWPGLEPLKQFRSIGATPVQVGKAVEGALVYEGALPFAPKIEVRRAGDGQWRVHNRGDFTLLDVLLVPAGEREKCVLIGSLAAGKSVTVSAADGALQDLAGSTEMLLRGTGLFPKEVTALRKTLLSSTFVLDPGARVLARVPQKQWEKLFPLTIEPKPRQLLRVGVLRLFDAEHYDAKDTGRIPLAVTGGRPAGRTGTMLGAGAAAR
ncbi:MAG: hypothetical protein ACYTGX_13380 [Planctomycetota bacterium]